MATELERTKQAPAAAGQLDMAVAPAVSELPAVRASVARWLRSDREHLDVVDDVVLAVSEMAHLAMQRGVADQPVALHLRRTHSIVVVEVAFHRDDGDGDVTALFESSVAALAMQVIDHVADRMTVDESGLVVTVRCSFALPPADADPGQGGAHGCR